jgi:hypothetical protein
MSTRLSLTPLADLGRSAGQAPLHGLHAAGVAAARHDAEIGARLLQRARIDVRLFGCILDEARRLAPRASYAEAGLRLPEDLVRPLFALTSLLSDVGGSIN